MDILSALAGCALIAASLCWLDKLYPLIERARAYPSDTAAAVIGWIVVGTGAVACRGAQVGHHPAHAARIGFFGATLEACRPDCNPVVLRSQQPFLWLDRRLRAPAFPGVAVWPAGFSPRIRSPPALSWQHAGLSDAARSVLVRRRSSWRGSRAVPGRGFPLRRCRR